jgi:hypothetical protein
MMRMQLTERWTIELDGAWERRRQRRDPAPVTWTGPVGTLQVEEIPTAAFFHCVSDLEILAAPGNEVPPGPVGRLGEPGTGGIGHRAVWIYPDALWSYTFVDRHYLRTVFLSADSDLRWAFTAWRSIRYAGRR